MSHSESGFGGSFSVDGSAVEVDLAEFGWPGDRQPAHDSDETAGPGAPAAQQHDDDGRIRLQKALAHAGIASRRACEALITGGRVTVNGAIERELGSRINPESDEVRVDGVVVQLDATKRYFVLNKPLGVVSTMSDEQGRPDLSEFTDQIEDRLYNVGRLDTDTSGLLILTNDGELAHKLAHPSFGVYKTYVAKVRGEVSSAVIQQLRDGVELKDGFIQADRAKVLPGGSRQSHTLVEITLHSGRNRIVRRLLAHVGHPVEELVRRQFGPLHLGTLRVGEMRELASAERGALLSATSVDEDAAAQSPEAGSGARGAARGGRSQKPSGAQGGRRPITAGRPGDGKGAQGMRGIAAKGNPHGRRNADEQASGERFRDDRGHGRDDRGRGRDDRGREFRGRDERSRDERGREFRGRDERGRDERGNSSWSRDRQGREHQGRDERGREHQGRDRDERGRGRDDRGRDERGRDNRGRDDRGGARTDRGHTSSGRGSWGRDDRGGRQGQDFGRGQRDERNTRDTRDNRGFGRDNRNTQDDRGGRGAERGFDRGGRGAERGYDRGGRGAERGYDRGARDSRGDRGERGARDDRGQRNDRGFDRGNDRGGNDSRGGWSNRENRGQQHNRRDDRGFERRDDRGRGQR